MADLAKPGTKVTEDELTTYRYFRSKGYSCAAAAEKIGRSTSWAYTYERGRREGFTTEGHPTSEAALDFVEACFNEDERAFKGAITRYGEGELMCAVAYLSIDMAGVISHMASTLGRIKAENTGEPQEAWDKERALTFVRQVLVARDDIEASEEEELESVS